MKAGTTSLHLYINQHPNCIKSRFKELRAFDETHRFGLCLTGGYTLFDKYARYGYSRKPSSLKTSGQFAGETSPRYAIMGNQALLRIKAAVPKATLIMIFRDPIERIWSHFKMDLVHELLVPQNFSYYVQRQISYLNACGITSESTTSEFESCFLTIPRENFDWVSRSLYAFHLENVLKVFPRKQIVLFKFEDFFKDPLGGLNGLFDKFKVGRLENLEIKRYNDFWKDNPEPVLTEEGIKDLKMLREFYKPYNRRFQKLISPIDISSYECENGARLGCE